MATKRNLYKRVMKGYNGNWDLPLLELGKLDLMHWDWDLTTGKGMNNFENENGISLLQRSPTESII